MIKPQIVTDCGCGCDQLWLSPWVALVVSMYMYVRPPVIVTMTDLWSWLWLTVVVTDMVVTDNGCDWLWLWLTMAVTDGGCNWLWQWLTMAATDCACDWLWLWLIVAVIHYDAVTVADYGHIYMYEWPTLSAVSATLNTNEASLKRRFSVGTNPSRNMLIPGGTK